MASVSSGAYIDEMHAQPQATPQRRYDKGERRHKHVGRGASPEIEYVGNNPRRWVGKCPKTLTPEDHVRLLNEAIEAPKGDRELNFAKKLYTVHDGAIYEGQTTDRGGSYHGYPYRGRLSRSLVTALREIAGRKNCMREFEAWVRQHIEVHGQ